MNPWFLAAYLILGGLLVTVELIGVHRKKQDGDTIHRDRMRSAS